jgi:hypothetical protein
VVCLLWYSSRSRLITAIIYLLGAAGGLIVVASTRDARVPGVAAGMGFVFAILACYEWIFRRQRLRGGAGIDALHITYGARLTGFERAFFLACGLGLVALLVLFTGLGWSGRVAFGVLSLWLLYCGVTGRPPTPGRAPAAEATDNPIRSAASESQR